MRETKPARPDIDNSASTSGNTLPFIKGKLILIYRAFLFMYVPFYQHFIRLDTLKSRVLLFPV